jgi:hypothetical protein
LDLTPPRFAYLELHSHNYMRITRMLTSVGLLGLAYLQLPFITAMLRFCVEGRLANVVDSCLDYWIGTVLNKADRDSLHDVTYELIQVCVCILGIAHLCSLVPGCHRKELDPIPSLPEPRCLY